MNIMLHIFLLQHTSTQPSVGGTSEDKTELRQKYFSEKSSYSLETRLEMQEVIEEINKEKENIGDVPKKEKKSRKLFMSDGKPFNINEPKLEFTMNDSSPSEIILTLQVRFSSLDIH